MFQAGHYKKQTDRLVGRDRRLNRNNLAVHALAVFHYAVRDRIQRVIRTPLYIAARMNACSALSYKDGAGSNLFPAKFLNA